MRFSTVTLLVSATSATMALGGCPNISIENVEAAAMVGKWYEVERETFIPFEIGSACATQEYSLNNNEGDLDFSWRMWTPMMEFGSYQSVQGELFNFGSSDPSTCTVHMDFAKSGYDNKEGYANPQFGYDIIATDDFQNWFVYYLCMEMIEDGVRIETIHIQSREKTITDAQLADAHAAIKAKLPDYDVSGWTLTKTDHATCEQAWLW